ncbi:MAG TPA: hypothetical protein VG733_15495, partial [Chthoniobacteraceae bacterium]|nr:hypothetical protein [Chthoniobacteraceae bacterium]
MNARWLAGIFAVAVAVFGVMPRVWAQLDDLDAATPEQRAKMTQLANEDGAAQAVLYSARLKANDLYQEKSDAEALVADNARALRDLKAAAANAKAALEDAKAKSAAAPGDAGLANALAQAQADAQQADAAAAHGQAVLDAAIVAMLKTAQPATDAARAFVDAQTAADIKHKARTDYENDLPRLLAGARAEKWFAASQETAQKGHFSATMQLGFGESFRYDHYPAVERIVTPQATVFVREPGKPWSEPDPADRWKPGKPADEKQRAELDTAVELMMRPLHPASAVSGEGALVWKTQENAPYGNYDLTREHPAPPANGSNGQVWCTFNTKSFDGAGSLLRITMLACTWKERVQSAQIRYYYMPGEAAPAPGMPPEEIAERALDDAASATRRVDAVAAGIFNFGPQTRVRVRGLIAGKDFDLTITYANGDTLRQIAVGTDFWTSTNGIDWAKQTGIDRMFFDHVNFAEGGADASWMLRAEIEQLDGGPGDEGDGEWTLLRIIPGLGPGTDDPSRSYWVSMKDGKPVLRRLEKVQPATRVYAMFDTVNKDGAKIMPPPGNPAAVAPGAHELVAQAMAAMKSAGIWKADLTVRPVRAPDANAKANAGANANAEPDAIRRVHGIFAGPSGDFDLVAETFTVKPAYVERLAAVNGVVRYQAGDTPWQGGHMSGEAPFGHVDLPFDADFTDIPCEAAGTATLDGETLLHIR